MLSQDKIIEVKNLIEGAELSLQKAKNMLNKAIGGKDVSLLEKAKTQAQAASGKAANVIEGVFDGQNMIGPDGKQYSVPANYASKSKLVEGDLMKLTIDPFGNFTYKQIGPMERTRLRGSLSKDEANGEWRVVADGRAYRVLLASVTYFKGDENDTAVILVPKDKSSTWAAVENIVKSPFEEDAKEHISQDKEEVISEIQTEVGNREQTLQSISTFVPLSGDNIETEDNTETNENGGINEQSEPSNTDALHTEQSPNPFARVETVSREPESSRETEHHKEVHETNPLGQDESRLSTDEHNDESPGEQMAGGGLSSLIPPQAQDGHHTGNKPSVESGGSPTFNSLDQNKPEDNQDDYRKSESVDEIEQNNEHTSDSSQSPQYDEEKKEQTEELPVMKYNDEKDEFEQI